MLPAALASSVARPYWNHGGGPPPDITRTAQGTVSAAGAPLMTMQLGLVSVPAGDTLLTACCYDNNLGTTIMGADVSGLGIPFNFLSLNFGVPSVKLVFVYSDPVDSPFAGWLTFDWMAGTTYPFNACALASSFTLLKTAGLDRTKTATGGPSTTQDSTLTAATNQAHELIWGIIGTQAGVGDAVGNWQAGMAAGQNVVGTGVGVKEGWQVVNAIGTYRAEVLLATSRRFGARVATWKGL